MERKFRNDWPLGFLAILSFFGIRAIFTKETTDLVWLVWLIWLIYFIPTKDKKKK